MVRDHVCLEVDLVSPIQFYRRSVYVSVIDLPSWPLDTKVFEGSTKSPIDFRLLIS